MFFVFFFSFVRPESEDLRIDIAVLLESLIMGSFQAATPPPRINAFLVGDTKIPTNPHTPWENRHFPLLVGGEAPQKKNIQTYILILILCTRNS